MKYRIQQRTTYNGYGCKTSSTIWVEAWKKTLFGWRWKEIRHSQFDCDGDYKVTTTFQSAEDAETFLRDILAAGKPVSRSTIETLREIDI